MFRSLITLLAMLSLGCSNAESPANIDAKKIRLSTAETKFIENHKVVTWAVEDNRPPFIYLEDDVVKGISADYLAIISKKTGLIFKPIPVPNFKAGIKAVKDSEIDLMTAIRPSEDTVNSLGFTSPYVYNAGVFVFRLSSQPRSPLRSGICQGDGVISYLTMRFPDMKITQTEDNEEAVSLLEKGLLDVVVMNEASADYLASKSIIKMRKANADYDYPYSFGFKKENIILGEILSKAIASISVEEKAKMNDAWKKEIESGSRNKN